MLDEKARDGPALVRVRGKDGGIAVVDVEHLAFRSHLGDARKQALRGRDVGLGLVREADTDRLVGPEARLAAKAEVADALIVEKARLLDDVLLVAVPGLRLRVLAEPASAR